ncbi:hypothetical protein [Nonomuraea sp. NPDC048916]|uniref:hypothetical protein n=1 Tax=Nonomuraea sp. NPDC048916 TaxID=3154232 RepID=UPI0033CF6EC0
MRGGTTSVTGNISSCLDDGNEDIAHVELGKVIANLRVDAPCMQQEGAMQPLSCRRLADRRARGSRPRPGTSKVNIIMYGPSILTRFLTGERRPDRHGNTWQYHPRSDRHSKVACWGVALDLLASSSLLRDHAQQTKVIIGVNHTMRDYATGRKKDLDLVIARPEGAIPAKTKTFASLAAKYGITLTSEERGVLDQLPPLYVAPVSAVLIALEAKACMTEHVKALPRLYDELNSSHLCVHGASSKALAIAYVQVNAADGFISPLVNNLATAIEDAKVTPHKQPECTSRVLQKVAEIPRRSASSDNGFDGVGVTVLKMRNDGSPVDVLESAPAPQPNEQFHYGSMIIRMANEYDATFARI